MLKSIRMTKEQTDKFNKLYDTTVTWGDMDDQGTCTGLFADFGKNLEQLSTGVNEEDDVLELYLRDDTYSENNVGSIPLRPKAKAKAQFKKVVCYLMNDDNNFDDLPI